MHRARAASVCSRASRSARSAANASALLPLPFGSRLRDRRLRLSFLLRRRSWLRRFRLPLSSLLLMSLLLDDGSLCLCLRRLWSGLCAGLARRLLPPGFAVDSARAGFDAPASPRAYQGSCPEATANRASKRASDVCVLGSPRLRDSALRSACRPRCVIRQNILGSDEEHGALALLRHVDATQCTRWGVPNTV